jgi:hypothetical protein
MLAAGSVIAFLIKSFYLAQLTHRTTGNRATATGYISWRTGTTTRFLLGPIASIDSSKIPAHD